MSIAPTVRRADKLMAQARIEELLATGYCGHLGTVGPDGVPYVCPLLFVWMGGEIWLHNTRAEGHLLTNVRHNPQACFEVDRPGRVFPYGRFQCDTSIEYQSVIAFGRLHIVTEPGQKSAFFDGLMRKYYPGEETRDPGFYPRLGDVTVYRLEVARMTGKETPLPPPDAQWPAVDNTKSPGARPPKKLP